MPEMSRGEVIRRLDAVAEEVRERLMTGPPFRSAERHALAQSLVRLLPLLAAGDLQGQEDNESTSLLVEPAERWDIEANPHDNSRRWSTGWWETRPCRDLSGG
jgi:hypothetical protein